LVVREIDEVIGEVEKSSRANKLSMYADERTFVKVAQIPNEEYKNR
jgi:hypothetical protein